MLQRPKVFVSEQEPSVVRLPLFALSAVSPNPAMGRPVRASVQLVSAVPRLLARLFDSKGRVVRVIHDAPAETGKITFDLVIPGAAKLPPGLYLLDVRAENLRQTRKFVLLGG